jgi:hypothetical protein
MAKYWFARQYPLSEAGATRMAPINGSGWMVVTFLGSCLLAGAAGLVVFSFTFRAPFIGVMALLGFGAVGLAALLVATMRKGDKLHTVEEYKSGRVVNPS